MTKIAQSRLRTFLRDFCEKSTKPKGRASYLSICAMYRDEGPYLDEWIRFHVSEGVGHFYLYDDDSSDSHLDVLEPWIESGIVTVIPAQGRVQEELFMNCLARNKRRGTWMAFIDIDEFLFAPDGESLGDKLSQYGNCSGIFVFWKLFGSGGLFRSTRQGVLEDFPYALPAPTTHSELVDQHEKWLASRAGKLLTGRPFQGKSIVRMSKITEMGVHFPTEFRGKMVDSLGRQISTDELRNLHFDEGILPPYEGLLIHHYWSRSLESLKQKFEKPGASRTMRGNRDHHPTIRQALNWDKHISVERDMTLAHRVRARNFPYIFVIGFNKTATRAFAAYFNENGLPAVHWDQNRLVDTMVENLKSGQKILRGYDSEYRVFTDFISASPTHVVEGNQYFREMDIDYPKSYFILNNRNTRDWLISRQNHGQGKFLERQLNLLNTNAVTEALTLWTQQKHDHEIAVREYFRDSSRFLEIDIDSENVPQKLETFLNIQMDHSCWRIIGKTCS